MPSVLAARVAERQAALLASDPASPSAAGSPSALTEVLAYGSLALLAAKKRGKVIGMLSKLMVDGVRV